MSKVTLFQKENLISSQLGGLGPWRAIWACRITVTRTSSFSRKLRSRNYGDRGCSRPLASDLPSAIGRPEEPSAGPLTGINDQNTIRTLEGRVHPPVGPLAS